MKMPWTKTKEWQAYSDAERTLIFGYFAGALVGLGLGFFVGYMVFVIA